MPEAFDLDRVIERFRGPLIGLIASWGVSARDAEELAADTFAEAFVSRERFRGDWNSADDAGPWLRGIASNLYGAWWRLHGRRRGTPAHELSLAATQSDEDERLEDLRRELAELPEQHAAILRAFYLEETSVAVVAALFGITTKAAEDRLYQARKALRERMERRASQERASEARS